MLVLTGVSGGLGNAVLTTILDQKLVDPSSIRVSSYGTKGHLIARAAAAGIEIRHGDMIKSSTVIDSYSGADAFFLVSYPYVGEGRFKYHEVTIDAAKEAGVKHILYTSLTWGGPAGERSIAGVLQAHLKTTECLKRSGLAWTIIREASYSHLWNNFAGFLNLDTKADFEVVISNDGPNHWANRQELDEGTAKIVANRQDYAGQTINLTGPRSFTVEEIVKMYAEYSGRRITRDFLPDWASWGEVFALGEAEYVGPTLIKLLGRLPKDITAEKDVLFSAHTDILDNEDFV